ncbi:MAG: hypothetical protein ABIR50_10995 [Ginsengibacter sp.]
MKKSIKLLGLCMLGLSMLVSVTAQKASSDDTISLKKRIYKISMITSDSKKVNGYLANLSDSNLYLSPSPLHISLDNSNNHLSSYSYDHLVKIEIKRKAAAGRSALQGALIGLTAGAITGLALGSDPVLTYNNADDPFGILLIGLSNAFRMTAGDKAVVGGFFGAASGALIGVLVGTLVKKKFIIGRNKEKFQAMKQNVLERLYTHQ